jgi:hypothetical protein
MTYTFKLARRLAVSRRFGMLFALLFAAGCAGENTMAPDGTSGNSGTPASLQVYPRSIVVQTNQSVKFRGRARTRDGTSIVTQIAWASTGGVMNPDGTFSSPTAGTFKVVGRGRGWKNSDTSTVTVVTPPSDLAGITVSPGSASLLINATKTFTASGVLADGSTTQIGATWTATGGTVDAAGVYTAGSLPGTYRVVAATTDGSRADTAVVTVTAPTLTKVVLLPASFSLTTGGTKQLTTYGVNSIGDTVAPSVTFSATGGTVNSTGLYTAGTTAGTYRVIAKSGTLADTAAVTLTAPAPAPTPSASTGSMVLGAHDLLRTSVVTAGGGWLRVTLDAYSASSIVTRIATARTNKYKLMLALTGGSHSNYLTNGVFDRAKWEAQLATFNTATIRDAVAKGVADGTIMGNSVMDEPQVCADPGSGGNTWGPCGTMTKARVDSLCADVKRIFPTLPAGVAHRHDKFEPTKSYRICDFLIDSYASEFGSVTTYRDAGLALAQRDHHAIIFSLGILDGGTRDQTGTWDCAGTGGMGTFYPHCRMTATQVRDFGLVLGPAGCAGLLMWRYDSDFMANTENQLAFKDVASRLASLPARSCTRQ